jgi:glutathione S-transferase
VDLIRRAHKQAAFIALNSFGEVPALEDGELALADSDAILMYLAKAYGGSRWQPASPAAAAAIQRWLSIAAGPLAFGPAAARAAVPFGAPHDLKVARWRAHDLFAVFELELARPRIVAPQLAQTPPASQRPAHRAARRCCHTKSCTAPQDCTNVAAQCCIPYTLRSTRRRTHPRG